MSASDVAPSRLERAEEEARKRLGSAPRAVLVVAGSQPQAFGPAPGWSLLGPLDQIRAEGRSSDLEGAITSGKRLLPEAPVLVIADAPAPNGADGYVSVAGNGQNVGITAVGPGFLALANSGPGLWKGEVSVDGKAYPAQVPAGGYASLEFPAVSFRARIAGNDALRLDDEASFSRRLVRVQVSGGSPPLERLLGLLGTLRGSPAELVFEIGTPKAVPKEFTVYFARSSGGQAAVYDVERTLSYLRGAELVGYTLSIPPKPGPGWQPLATGETGQALAWYSPNGIYLPPAETLQNLPAFPVLLYNLIAPRSAVQDGLLAGSQTLLPRPTPNRPLPPTLTLQLAPWLALLAALTLISEFYFFQYRLRQSLEPLLFPTPDTPHPVP